MGFLRKLFDKLRRKGAAVKPEPKSRDATGTGNATGPAPVKLDKAFQELMLRSPFPHCIIAHEVDADAVRPPSTSGRVASPEPLKWTVVDVSDTFANMMGFPADELVGQDWFDIVDPKVADKLASQISVSGPDFRMKTVLMSRAMYVDEEGMAASAVVNKSAVPLRTDVLGVLIPETKFMVLVVLSVSLLQNLVNIESIKATDDVGIPMLTRNKSMSKSFVLRQVDVASNRNVARMPSFLRPQKFPQDSEAKKAGQEAVKQLDSDDMQEVVQRSRRRRDKRTVQLNDETFDERCRKWLLQMVEHFGLPGDSEASFTLKLWASTVSRSQLDPGFVPLRSMHFDSAEDDDQPDTKLAANTMAAAGPISIDSDEEDARLQREKSKKVVVWKE